MRKGNLFHLTAAYYRGVSEIWRIPFVNFAVKYFSYLSTLTAPYFFVAVPLGLLNVLIVWRVARECPGVWYHVAQAISDLIALIAGLINMSFAYVMFAPLFAWTNNCQSLAFFLFDEISVFFQLFSLFSLTLLCFDRYLSMCYPTKVFVAGGKSS